MLRSQTVLTIHDLYAQEKSVQEIAQELEISRTAVRKYLKHPEAVIRKPRPPQPSKLDPYKEQIKKWVREDHCTNCEVMLVRLQKLGYTGGISILKEFVHPLRPAVLLLLVVDNSVCSAKLLTRPSIPRTLAISFSLS